MDKKKLELLAPAGSIEALKAAISAGADAVYIGGNKFGARAYAQNPDEEELLRAIDYVHLRKKSIYLTVNTLLKNDEIAEELYNYVAPLYECGLDALIVQDLGVFKFLKENFPGINLHASTQMTITGDGSAKILEDLGASRIVTARELSLHEIKKIRNNTKLEIESFVHGAICYSYSGQCLFSSLAGGRSGNRGRCAQPCRMGYRFFTSQDSKKPVEYKSGCDHLLSLKDMNTIEILPQIIDAGVYSLKIEGRMKKPEYCAGVVSIYRKYADMYLCGDKYNVSAEDKNRLFDLFNRDGFSRGYYEQHNGKNMLALNEPVFRLHDENWNNIIKEKYIDTEKKVNINASVYIGLGEETTFCAYTDDASAALSGAEPLAAQNKPLDEKTVIKQFSKLGNTDFNLENIDVSLKGNCFLSAGAMNELRRNVLSELSEELLKPYRRTSEGLVLKNKEINKSLNQTLSAQVHTLEQLLAVLDNDSIPQIYIDYTLTDCLGEILEYPGIKTKEVYYHFPNIFREKSRIWISKWLDVIRNPKIKGYIIGSLEAYAFAKEAGLKGEFIADYNLYTFNDFSKDVLKELGFSTFTSSPELNGHELLLMDNSDRELIIYGRTVMMTTANCLHKTLDGCKNFDGVSFGAITDKDNRKFPVEFDCRNCCNVIYNNVPTYLGDMLDKLKRDGFKAYRIVFSNESRSETLKVLDAVLNMSKLPDTTKGHFNRGVE